MNGKGRAISAPAFFYLKPSAYLQGQTLVQMQLNIMAILKLGLVGALLKNFLFKLTQIQKISQTRFSIRDID